MEVGAAPKEAAARPFMAPNGPIVGAFTRRGLQGVIHVLLKAVARFRRLLGALARQPGLLLSALLRAPGSLADLVRLLLSSKPARLLVAAAASIICITLQYHRPATANIHLSSSISLLFGMVKLQGSLAVQLEPPEPRGGAAAQQPAEQHDELRINCPKDLRESIVRFLESQAARNFASAGSAPPGWELSPLKEQQQPQPPLPLPPFEEGLAAEAVAEAAAAAARTAVGDAGPEFRPDDGGVPATGVMPSLDALLPSTPPLGCSPPAKGASLAGAGAIATSVAAEAALESVEGGASGRGNDAGALPAPLPTPQPSQQLQQLSPRQQPLHDPAFLALFGPRAADAAPALDRSDYLSLMSYAASYKPSMAALDSPRSGIPTPGSAAAGFSAASGEVPGCVGPEEEVEVESSTEEVEAAGTATAGTAAVAGGRCHKSPDSILGLRSMGLEGWTARNRDWESRYLEE